MALLNIDDFNKEIIKEHYYYIYMPDAKFHLYSYCNQAFIAHWLYNSSKSINIVKFFFLLIAVSNRASFIFQYIAQPIFFQLKYPSACNIIGFSRCTHNFLRAVFNKQAVFAFHDFFLFWPVMFTHSFF